MLGHAKYRARETYNLELTKPVHDQIVSDIQSGKSWDAFVETNSRVHHTVEVDGQEMRVVYNKQRKALHTFLPLDGGEGDTDHENPT
jgi:hypothetical protein